MTPFFFDSVVLASFVVAVVGFLLLVYALRINKYAHVNYIRTGVLFIAQLVILVAATLITDAKEDERSRLRLKAFLDRKNIGIIVNDTFLDTAKTRELSGVLKTVADPAAHHSHPISSIRVQLISDRDTLDLTLGQDSQYPTEYWVFNDRNQTDEIGRIRTQFFAGKSSF